MAESYDNLGCMYAISDKLREKALFEKVLEVNGKYMDVAFNFNQISYGKNEFKITKRELRRTLIKYKE